MSTVDGINFDKSKQERLEVEYSNTTLKLVSGQIYCKSVGLFE